jgi:hypothetical protein
MSYSYRSKQDRGVSHRDDNEEPSNSAVVTRKITHYPVRLDVNSRDHSRSALRAKMMSVEPSHAGKMAGPDGPSVEKETGIL